MSAELSYVQLKAANDARVSEEVRSEQRRRNLLVLINHYLRDEGFLDTAGALEREVGPSIARHEVCDNIDLPTVLQEYEAYYFVKFKRNPKITRRVALSAEDSNSKTKSTHKSLKTGSPLPPIKAREGGGVGGRRGRPSSDGRRKEQPPSTKHPPPSSSSSSSSSSYAEALGLTGSAIATAGDPKHSSKKAGVVNVRGMLQNAIADASAAIDCPQERLLKPLAGFAGYNAELRDLAAVISRDIYSHNPDVHWDDIIGLDAAKRLVKEAVVYPIKYPQLFTGILSPWKGLLLYGPPGTGKTMLAKAVATECGTTFFNISASSIVSKWRGDSEKLVRVLFELARFHAPSTIFMDELESIMGQRGSGGPGGEHEGSRRMKTELLVQMDGLARSSDLVFVLAASNLPWELDHAMLRRLEKRILVGLPSVSARSAMFQHHLPPCIAHPPLSITTHIHYQQAAQLTDGYSGSDVKLVCKEAAMRPVRKVFDRLEDRDSTGTALDDIEIEAVTTEDVEIAISNTKPSARQLAGRYTKWQTEYESV